MSYDIKTIVYFSVLRNRVSNSAYNYISYKLIRITLITAQARKHFINVFFFFTLFH